MEKSCVEFFRHDPTVDICDWNTNELIEQLKRGRNNQRFQYCLDSNGTFVQFKGITLVFLNQELHSIMSGLIARRRDTQRGRQTVFLTAVDPADEHRHRQVDHDITKPRVLYKDKWKVHEYTVYLVQVCVAQQNGLTSYQTRSHAIIHQDTVPSDSIAKVRSIKTKEVL